MEKITRHYWLGSIIFFAMLMNLPNTLAQANAPTPQWFRYYKDGVPQTSKAVTDAHIANGYEELDESFQVIRKVSPYSKAQADAQEVAQEARNKLLEERGQLMKIYGSSARATHKRAQLIGDISSKRTFAQQQLISANTQLQTELSKAAQLEKNQETIPEEMKANINTRHAAVQAAKANLDSLMTQQLQEVKQISQDIRRLRKFEIELSGGATVH